MADIPPDAGEARPRRKFLTPEQRRLLATSRVVPPPASGEKIEAKPAPIPPAPTALPEQDYQSDGASPKQAEPPPSAGTKRPEAQRRGNQVEVQVQSSRQVEVQQAVLILGAIVILAAAFFGGLKFNQIKGFIMSRISADELNSGKEKFPGMTSGELVESGLAAERRGEWQDASDRLIEAKRKDLRYQGILFHLGKSAYDRRDWDAAEHALDQALKFGENVAVANQLRGLIAVRKHDLPAAERYFEAASKAEPFLCDFLYLWGDTLRLNQHPRDAIARYQQGIQRSRTQQDVTLFRYKIRLARLEAAEASALSAEVEAQRKAGPLPVDWLLTDAAIQIQAGKITEAARLISQASNAGTPNLFLACAGDNVFLKASESHPEIAAVALQPAPAK